MFHSFVSLLEGKKGEFTSNKQILQARIAVSGKQRVRILSANNGFFEATILDCISQYFFTGQFFWPANMVISRAHIMDISRTNPPKTAARMALALMQWSRPNTGWLTNQTYGELMWVEHQQTFTLEHAKKNCVFNHYRWFKEINRVSDQVVDENSREVLRRVSLLEARLECSENLEFHRSFIWSH